MSSLVFSIPGKSFLAGEYLALKGGPSLLFASNPRFELHTKTGNGKVEGIHPDSPAGQLIADHQDFFSKYDLKFMDPHEGRGGWGASTAQFLATFVFSEWRESCELETLKSLSISRLLESYWKYAWNGEGYRPSGADLVAQYKGALTFFDRDSGHVGVYSWIFAEIDFALIPTGKKLATHEHLKSLKEFNADEMEAALTMIRSSLVTGNAEEFIGGIKANAKALAHLGFVASHTEEFCAEWLGKTGVLAVKGCGALGSDVVLVVFDKKHADLFRGFVTSKDLSHGLEIQVKE